ncbi:MAG: ABC transporter permease [Pyrinomonadaceae bacterium]
MNSLVFSNMLHRPARTVVSILGIGVGILLILFTVGLANGSLRDRAKRDANVGAEIMFRASGSLGLGNGESLRLPESMLPEIAKVEGVAAVVPIAQGSVAATDGLTASRLLEGIPFDRYAAMAGLAVVQGRAMVDGRDEMMCDSSWLQQRKMKIGDKLSMYEKDFEIVGAYEPSAGARVKIPLSTMQAQVGAEGKASAFLIKVKEGYKPSSVGDNIHAKFPDNQIILTSDLEELYMQGIPALNVFLNVVIGVAAVVSGLIILLTMYTTVTERTRQIGVLKSLGMSNTNIAWTIVQEALLISFGGVVFGVLATLLLRLALTKWSTLTVNLEPRVALMIAAIALVSGALGALYPGLRAARLDAVEALNYD